MVKKRDLKQLTMDVLQKFYQGDPIELWKHLHPMALWDGPANYKCLYGKEAIVRTLSDSCKMQRPMVMVNGRGLEAVPGLFRVMAEYVEGEAEPSAHSAISDPGHLMVLWVRESEEYPWRILEVHQSMQMKGRNEEFYLKLEDTNRVWRWIASSDILYVEAVKSHCYLVTKEEIIEVLQNMTELTRQSEGILLKVHRSYLVNPSHISTIHRFRATLSNGTQIPIPEKKYTTVRQALLSRL